MWNEVILRDARTLMKAGGPADIANAIALHSPDINLTQFQNCTNC